MKSDPTKEGVQPYLCRVMRILTVALEQIYYTSAVVLGPNRTLPEEICSGKRMMSMATAGEEGEADDLTDMEGVCESVSGWSGLSS